MSIQASSFPDGDVKASKYYFVVKPETMVDCMENLHTYSHRGLLCDTACGKILTSVSWFASGAAPWPSLHVDHYPKEAASCSTNREGCWPSHCTCSGRQHCRDWGRVSEWIGQCSHHTEGDYICKQDGRTSSVQVTGEAGWLWGWYCIEYLRASELSIAVCDRHCQPQ